MLKIKNFFQLSSEKFSRWPAIVWLMLLILLPLNFFCLKEKFLKEKNAPNFEMAFSSPETSASPEVSLEKITEFSVFSSNKKATPCVLNFFLNQEKISEKKVSLKNEKKIILPEEAVTEKIIEQKGGKLEITLQCENFQENIYKYLSL